MGTSYTYLHNFGEMDNPTSPNIVMLIKYPTLTMNNPVERHSKSNYSFDLPYPTEWQKLSDEALITQYKQTGNQLIVCYLMQRYKSAILAISMSYLKSEEAVKDFTHDLFIKLVKLLKQSEVQKFQSFLVTVVKNKHKDELSKFTTSKNYENRPDHPSAFHPEQKQDFELDNPINAEALQKLKDEGELSDMEHACLSMYLDEFKSGEIAEHIDPKILGIKQDELATYTPQELLTLKKEKVYGAIERARRKLRRLFQKEYGGYFKD